MDICYHMNGGVTWDVAWTLSFQERERMIKLINKKLKEMSGSKKEYM